MSEPILKYPIYLKCKDYYVVHFNFNRSLILKPNDIRLEFTNTVTTTSFDELLSNQLKFESSTKEEFLSQFELTINILENLIKQA